MRKKSSLFSMLLVMLLLAGCSPAVQTLEPLRVAVLPVLDTLPLFVAAEQGYFEEAGLEVELVPVSSAPERDQLMQAGQIDGMLNELSSTILYNRDETRVLVVRFARIATSEYPVFRILAAPDSGISQPADLRGVPVAVSDGTIIEYTTDRLLEQAGLTPGDVEKVSVPKIPDRMALLMSGEIAAANLPDPVASLAMLNGATLVIDDSSLPEISFSVYSFSVATLESNPEAVERFLEAVEKAVEDINADKTRWNTLLSERSLVPEAILSTYVLPDYPEAGVPDETQFEDALAWLMQKGLVEQDSAYSDHIDPGYLP